MNLAIVEEPCPLCRFKLHFKTQQTPQGPRPAPGTLSVCVQCGTVLTFDEAMHLRLANQKLIAKLSYEERAALRGVQDKVKANLLKAQRERAEKERKGLVLKS
jgi:hypothetical protein